MKIGAAAREITPKNSQFLAGYPHVERYSTGVHDPIMSSALYVDDEHGGQALFISNDVVFFDKYLVAETRNRIARSCDCREDAIMVTTTHTHSGPITVSSAANRGDPVVPKPDPAYRSFLVEQAAAAGRAAVESAQAGTLGFARAQARGVGTNRRSPDGPCDPEVPVLIAYDASRTALACMVVYAMHPTVLHEDSTLISGDFPAFTRRYLCEHAFGRTIPIVYHTGTAGNQSPRYVTKENTFAEAERLGHILGESIEKALSNAEEMAECTVAVERRFVSLPRKKLPTVDDGRRTRDGARRRLDELGASGAPRQEVRTAETDWFGAERILRFAEMSAAGELEEFYRQTDPAELQAIRIGGQIFLGIPGEIFVEYGLAIKESQPDTYPIAYANGELQGYIVTAEAAREGGYEAWNGLYAPEAGTVIVQEATGLVSAMRAEKGVGRNET